MRTSLGRQLAVLRRSAGLTQGQLGHRTGYSRSSIAHVEAGRQTPDRTFWQRTDDIVEADGALVGAYADVMDAAQRHVRPTAAQGPCV